MNTGTEKLLKLNIQHPTSINTDPRPSGSEFDVRCSMFDVPRGRGREQSGRPAFTLIELLVVIAIIAILAALLLPVAGTVRNRSTLKRVQGEVAQASHAIESYKIDKGFYPPDNKPANGPVLAYPNTLYYELTGVTVGGAQNNEFTSVEGGLPITSAQLNAVNASGINNAGRLGNTEGLVSKNYLPDIKPNQHGPGVGGLQVLGTTVEGPFMYGEINPFRYISSSPTNNPEKYDLWVDVLVAGKTNRISNWSDEAEILN
jgi:prepilin-type N-terminal cleavage/methylation domain-containing protein